MRYWYRSMSDQLRRATPLWITGQERVSLRTERPFQLVDVTDAIAGLVNTSGLEDGAVQLYCGHTSCGLAVTELEDGLHEDIERVLEQLAPIAGPWAHDDMSRRWQNIEPDERRNGWSHIRGLLATQPSIVLPITEGELALGQWQRVFLVELDGGRERSLLVQAWGSQL